VSVYIYHRNHICCPNCNTIMKCLPLLLDINKKNIANVVQFFFRKKEYEYAQQEASTRIMYFSWKYEKYEYSWSYSKAVKQSCENIGFVKKYSVWCPAWLRLSTVAAVSNSAVAVLCNSLTSHPSCSWILWIRRTHRSSTELPVHSCVSSLTFQVG